MTADVLTLVRKPLAQIVAFWRPGSREWTWAEEYHDLMTRDGSRTAAILRRVGSEGIGFIDDAAPVLLGNDGRVWDGHHRICIALAEGIPELMVEVVDQTAENKS